MTSRRTSTARRLRQTAGSAEQKTWKLLRAGAVDGHKFRRQHPIEPYFADFACEALMLIIELDGAIHEQDDVVTRDHYRQLAIEGRGWSVIRFANADALARPELIIQAIRDHAAAVRGADASGG